MLMAKEEPHVLEGRRRETELFEGRGALAVIEDPQHNVFAEDRAER